MSYFKALVFAAIAALALVAFVGAGVASAESTTLCKVNEATCSEANMVKVGDEISSTLKAGTEAVLKAGFGSVKCKKAAASGKLEGTGGEVGRLLPQDLFGSVSFEECNCPVTVVKAGTLHIKWTIGVRGNVSLKGFEVKVGGEGITCFLINNFECIYSGEVTEKLTLEGGNPAKMVASEAVIPRTGGKSGEFVCGNSAKWTAEGEVTTPNPMYVTKMATP